MLDRTLHISTSPHIRKGISTDTIMLHVVLALLPVAAFAVFSFGWNALLLLFTTTAACVLTEHLLCRWSGQASTVSDWSAVITGLLLGLTLPPIFPLWMAFLGGVIAIALGKFIFSGLGYNVFNPALVGRAVLQALLPVARLGEEFAPLAEGQQAVVAAVGHEPALPRRIGGELLRCAPKARGGSRGLLLCRG